MLATLTPDTTAPVVSSGGSDEISAEAIVQIIIVGLLLLALILTIVTVRYIRATKPFPPALEPLEVMSRRRWRKRPPSGREAALARLRSAELQFESRSRAVSASRGVGTAGASGANGSPAAGEKAPEPAAPNGTGTPRRPPAPSPVARAVQRQAAQSGRGGGTSS